MPSVIINTGYRLLLVLILCLCNNTAWTQIQFSGRVQDAEGHAIQDVSISVNDDLYQVNTNAAGIFTLEVDSPGRYQVFLYHPDYEEMLDSLSLGVGPDNAFRFVLKPNTILEEQEVYGKSSAQQKREEPIRAIVLDTRAYMDQPSSLSELMNRSAGVRIRQSGGLGNATDISINGFQGNSVQYFRDGIPLEYLGGAYNINNVPANLLQRVEVYKGVIPVTMGADALGGAVNLVSRADYTSYLNASYEIGSFNTHVLNLTGLYLNKKNTVFAGGNIFFNYSDNDYKADVTVTDPFTANPVPANVRLFHNSYRQYYAEFFAGVKNRKWADELRFTFSHYAIDRASQHPALMTVPYGAVMMYNTGYAGSARYQKLFSGGRLSLDQFITYSSINRSRVDTVKGTYDWLGNFTPRVSGIGESPRPSLSDIDFNNFISRTNLKFRIWEGHTLELNVVYNYNHRSGADPYGLRFAGTDIDVLSMPALYAKTVGGLAYETKLPAIGLINQLQVKSFSFNTKGVNGFLAVNANLDDYETVSSHHWGVGDALKYQINTRSFVRASAELTYRLPGQLELFGDNDTRAPNFELKPERSFNVNIGYSYMVPRFHFEVSAFYRKTSGMIMLVPIQPPFAQYTNLDSIRGYGLDFDMNYEVIKNMWISANFSWQENRMVDISNALYDWMNGTRLRNTPFFFANAGITGSYKNIFTKEDQLKPYIYYNFVREFYLNHIPKDREPGGFLGLFGKSGVPVTNLIPDQHLVNAGLTYGLPGGTWTCGLEVKNLLDEDLYDYYKIQRAGRSFHFKINYFLKHKN